MNYSKCKIALTMGVVMLCGLMVLPSVHAGGTAVQFANVVLENLEPGGVYDLRALRGLTYTVLNNYEKTRDFQVVVMVPEPTELEKGYEPIPDPSWVRVVPNTFRLAHRENVRCTIIISIPENEEYRNRHFQVMFMATVEPDPFGKGVSLIARVKSRLRFSVGTRSPKTLEMAKEKRKYLTLNFHLEPESLYIHNVEVGKRIELGKKGVPVLKVVNLGPENVILQIESVPCGKGFGLVPGYESNPNPGFLKCTEDSIKVKSNRIKNVPLVLKIPDEPEYRGKKYAFIIKAELKDIEVPLEIYSRVYVQIKE